MCIRDSNSQATAAGHAGVVITGQLGQARAAGQTGAVGWKLHAPNRVATSRASGDPTLLGPAGCGAMSIRVLFSYEAYGLLSRLHLCTLRYNTCTTAVVWGGVRKMCIRRYMLSLSIIYLALYSPIQPGLRITACLFPGGLLTPLGG